MKENQINDIQALLEKMDMRTRRIENALTGDRELGIKGIAEKVDYHGKKISEFQTDKTKVIVGATVLGTLFGALSGFIHKFFN